MRIGILVIIGLAALSSAFPARAAGVVGTGTPASCTEAAFDAALAGGGAVTFNCGAAPHTIAITGSKTITSDTQIDGGGVIRLDGGGFTLIFYNSGVELTLANIRLQNARSIDGGAIKNDRGMLNLTNVELMRNVSVSPGSGTSGSGGALYSTGGAVTLRDSRLIGNRADRWGGAIFATESTVNIARTLFVGNVVQSSGDDGGAIANGNGSLPGGAFTIENSRFILNAAPLSGGAVYSQNRGSTAIENSLFGLNAANVGGAVSAGTLFGAEMTIEALDVANSSFLLNLARYDGGAITSGVSTNLNRTQLDTNIALRDGGGVQVFGVGLYTVQDSTFTRNIALRDGGGVFNLTQRLTIERSTLARNAAARSGGGVYTRQDYRSGFNLLVENSTFSANRALNGGGVFDDGASLSVRIRFSTFNRNQARLGASLHGANIQSSYSIFANPLGGGANCMFPLLTAGNNIVFPIAGCDSGFESDPLLLPLADYGGATLTHALMPASPAVDSVVGLGCVVPTDQRTVARPIDGNGDGVAVCDFGAVEYQMQDDLGMVAQPLTAATPAPQTATATPRPVNTVNCQTFRATSPLDGLPNGVVTFFWDAAPGAQRYTLRIFNDASSQVASVDIAAPTTSATVDVGQAAIGGGITFTYEILAISDDVAVCQASVTLLRESLSVPPSQPQCGNGIQEPGETPNTCPNGY